MEDITRTEEPIEDGVDLLLSMLEEDECDENMESPEERGIKRTHSELSVDVDTSLPKKLKTTESNKVEAMKAKMLAMEEELAKLKNELHLKSSAKPTNNTRDTGRAPGVVPTGFRKGKRVAHQQQEGAEIKRPKVFNEHKSSMKQTALAMEDTKDCKTDRYSGLRIKNPLISAGLMDERMKDRKMIKIPKIMSVIKNDDIEGDWVTIGIIVSKSLTKETCKGKKFSVWRLSDLSSQSANVSLFLFDKVYQSHWKTPVGHVVALLNATILTNKETGSSTGIWSNDNKYSLSLDNPAKLMDMGVSADFVICRATTKAGSQCKHYASKQHDGYCDYHVQREYNKMRSNRMNCQGGFGPSTQSLQKKLLGQSGVFYQGQMFHGGGGGASNGGRKSDHVVTNQRMFAPGVRKEMREIDELLGVKKESSSINNGSGLSSTNKNNAGMEVYKQLVQGQTPGALCLRKHLDKNPTSGSVIIRKDKSALDLLKEHIVKEEAPKSSSNGTDQSMAAIQPQGTGGTKQQSLEPKQRLSNSNKRTMKPKLSSPDEFELFRPDNIVKQELTETTPLTKPQHLKKPSSTVADTKPVPIVTTSNSSRVLRPVINSIDPHNKSKEKAIALVSSKGPLKKTNPNGIQGNKVLDTEKQDKIRRTLSMNDTDTTGTQSKDKENQRLLIEGEEFQKILNAKSSHNWAVEECDRDRQESYFNNLEKKEQLQERLSQITELNVRVVQCIKCEYIAESVGKRCHTENHSITRLRATKRCFKCCGCGQRTYTYNQIYPTKSCQCGINKYVKCSIYKEKSGPKLPSEVLLPRGEERKFLNSLN